MRCRLMTSSKLHFQFNVNNIADELNYSQYFGNRGTPAAGPQLHLFGGGIICKPCLFMIPNLLSKLPRSRISAPC